MLFGLEPHWNSPLGLLQLKINWRLMVAFGFLAVAILAPQRQFLGQPSSLFWTGILSVVGWRLMSGIQRNLSQFKPATVTEAKSVNEQIKLMATLLNNVGVAGVSVLAISEIARKPNDPNMVIIVVAIAGAIWFHAGGRGLLLHLKDETPASYPSVEKTAVPAA